MSEQIKTTAGCSDCMTIGSCLERGECRKEVLAQRPKAAISIRAPWWWLILHGGKDVENRDWPTRYRGLVYIHASKWFNAEEVRDDFEFAKRIMAKTGATLPPVTLRDLRDAGGTLVGTAEIIDCVEQSDSPWFFGRYGFALAHVHPMIARIPCKGALGFFRPDLEATQNVQA